MKWLNQAIAESWATVDYLQLPAKLDSEYEDREADAAFTVLIDIGLRLLPA